MNDKAVENPVDDANKVSHIGGRLNTIVNKQLMIVEHTPIAEGELHYKVRDEIAMEVYGEEIVLSHEVMEAVNGDSADILRLPNLKVFKYLRKHYTQQSGKLTDAIFQRTSWEMVRPEV